MAVKMGVDPEAVKAPQPIPGNQWYKLKLIGFKPKLSNKKDSVNFNAQLKVVENADPSLNDKNVYMGLNTKMARMHADFAHGFGFHLNPDGSLPGDWIPDDADPENVEKFQYKGPLLGRVLDAEVVVTAYQGNERNEVKQVRCKIEGCAQKHPEIRHSTNLIGNK